MDSSLIHRENLVIFHRKQRVLPEGQWLSTSLTGHLFEAQIPERQESQEPDPVSRGHVPGVRLAAPLFQVFQVEKPPWDSWGRQGQVGGLEHGCYFP